MEVEDDWSWDADPDKDAMNLGTYDLDLIQGIQCECTRDWARRLHDAFLCDGNLAS